MLTRKLKSRKKNTPGDIYISITYTTALKLGRAWSESVAPVLSVTKKSKDRGTQLSFDIDANEEAFKMVHCQFVGLHDITGGR